MNRKHIKLHDKLYILPKFMVLVVVSGQQIPYLFQINLFSNFQITIYQNLNWFLVTKMYAIRITIYFGVN